MFQNVSTWYWSCVCFFEGPSSLAESEAVCSELNVKFLCHEQTRRFLSVMQFFRVLSRKLFHVISAFVWYTYLHFPYHCVVYISV